MKNFSLKMLLQGVSIVLFVISSITLIEIQFLHWTTIPPIQAMILTLLVLIVTVLSCINLWNDLHAKKEK